MREVNVGDQLDQYRLTELIARSGMASIFKAVDELNGATVAIKIPYSQFESDVVFYSRFQREEEVVRRLEHPNVIKVYTPRRKSRMYIAMEYVEGVSLRALMRDKRPLPIDEALDYARQICAALVYLHSNQVVHRDLKPENVLVTDGGRLKIMDFGIALDETARRLTWSGLSSTIGTPDYMAPEQVSGKRGDARTDIYALGTMLYEMLTAELPYAAENVYNMMRAKTSEDPQRPTHYRPDLDPRLEEIVLHAIERIPRNRYDSAAEMLHDLDRPGEVVITDRAERLHPRSLAGQKIRRALWTVAFFGSLVGVLAFLIWLANRYPASPQTSQRSYRGQIK
ncbi:MAG TPA: serine/threonine-protein kinase [Candidatus Binataceae bacterium]|nr:serine/threonine-protein kinase [Candidatus Binataceae bacterium]